MMRVWEKIRNILDFFKRREYNIDNNKKEKEQKQMREKLMAMRAAAERDILYAQAKLEVVDNLLASCTCECAASVPVVEEAPAEAAQLSSFDTI